MLEKRIVERARGVGRGGAGGASIACLLAPDVHALIFLALESRGLPEYASPAANVSVVLLGFVLARLSDRLSRPKLLQSDRVKPSGAGGSPPG